MPDPPSPKSRPLSLKRQRLIQELPTASSNTQAGLRAGFGNGINARSAEVQVSRALSNPIVAAAADAAIKAATSEKVMSVVKRKERLSELATPDPEHPDPVSAIKELNRMERIGQGLAQPAEVHNTLIFQGFTLEELRALVAKGKEG